jgi:hypothetical protein
VTSHLRFGGAADRRGSCLWAGPDQRGQPHQRL